VLRFITTSLVLAAWSKRFCLLLLNVVWITTLRRVLVHPVVDLLVVLFLFSNPKL